MCLAFHFPSAVVSSQLCTLSLIACHTNGGLT